MSAYRKVDNIHTTQAGKQLKQGNETMIYYHGKRNAQLNFRSGICFTSDRDSAAAYGPNVFEVEIDRSMLSIKTIEMTDEELREAIDDQEWPCDRESDRQATIAAGYDAVEYQDVDERGQMHDCLRILTAEAFAAAVKIVEMA